MVTLEINGDSKAYPVAILMWHEIVNDEVGGVPVTVTFCPLCNIAIVLTGESATLCTILEHLAIVGSPIS